MSRFEDIRGRHSPRTAESNDRPAPEASEGSVTNEGEGAPGVGPVGEFFADAESPVVDRLTKGEEFSYLFEMASMMMREEGKKWITRKSTLGPKYL